MQFHKYNLVIGKTETDIKHSDSYCKYLSFLNSVHLWIADTNYALMSPLFIVFTVFCCNSFMVIHMILKFGKDLSVMAQFQ